MNQELKRKIFELKDKDIKILDLGCGLPTEYFCLFKEFKIKKYSFSYVGVDTKDEFEIYNNRPKEYLPERFDFNSDDLMLSKFNQQGCLDDSFEEDIKLEKDSFLSAFRFYFETDIMAFVSSLKKEDSFNVVILSNILHKISENKSEIFFSKCLLHLQENSLIFVSVLAECYPDPLPEDNLYCLERFGRLKDKVDVIWSSENINSHFQFIGQLKK